MEENNIQLQINEINRKLDLLLENVNEQRLKREEMDDLIEDLSIVGKDAFQNTVVALDKAGVELDSDALAGLAIKVIRNIGTFNEMIEMLESVNDFMKDFSPIIRQIGLDTVNKLHEFEQKGYLDYLAEMGRMLEKITENYSIEDFRNLTNNMDMILGTIKNLSTPELLNAAEKTTAVIARTNMDDTLDDKSLFRLFSELKSPEVRKTLFFSLRLLKEIVRANKNKY
jgi:uncharacterized protein YjgD (DUF1641 family)